MDPADLMGPTGPVTLEIVVPARNGARRLPGGLAALCQKAAGLPLSAAVLAVDSASTDGTSDVVRGDPRQPVPVRLQRCERPGKGVAGTSRARRSGAWNVAGPDGDVLAEGRLWISSSPPGPPCAGRPRRWRG